MQGHIFITKYFYHQTEMEGVQSNTTLTWSTKDMSNDDLAKDGVYVDYHNLDIPHSFTKRNPMVIHDDSDDPPCSTIDLFSHHKLIKIRVTTLR